MNQDALDLRIARRALQQSCMGGRPYPFIHRQASCPDHGNGAHLFSLLGGEPSAGHRSEPDVSIEADLMGGVAGQHRTAARLRNVAEKKPRPAVGSRIARQFLNEPDHGRVAPAPVARQPHGLPRRPVRGDRDASGKAALAVEAIRPGGGGCRQFFGAEQILGEFLRARFMGRYAGSAITSAIPAARRAARRNDLIGVSMDCVSCLESEPRRLPEGKCRKMIP